MNRPSASNTERRAGAARLSVCVSAGILAVVAAMLWAGRADAAPPAPVLTGTSPSSPNLTLTPRVLGSSTGIIISSFPGLRTSAITSAGSGGRKIYLYPNKTCAGAAFAEGSSEELDKGGIQITVVAESTTYISAEQEDEFGGLSSCSNAIEYQQVKELPKTEEPPTGPGGASGGSGSPPEPPRLRTAPSGGGNDLTPLVSGSAPGASSVKLYAVSNCAGKPLTTLSPGELSAGVSARVVANAVAAFSAYSIGPGGSSHCSAPAFYVEDSTPPHVRITMGPASKTRKRIATFRFVDTTGNLPGTTYLCRVDKAKWKACKSPMKIRHLRTRKYVFRVKAIDSAGNEDPKAAKRSFKVISPAGR